MSRLSQVNRVALIALKHNLSRSNNLVSLSRSVLVNRSPNSLGFGGNSLNTYSSIATTEIDEVESQAKESLAIESLQLSPLLKKSLARRDIKELFSIQVECFPHIVEGKDLVGRARKFIIFN